MGTGHPANRPPAPTGEGPGASTTPVLPCLRAGSGQAQSADPLQDPGTSPATSLTCLLPGDTSVRPPVGCVAGQRDVLLQSERDLAGTCPVQTPALSPGGPERAWKRNFQLLRGSGPHGAALALWGHGDMQHPCRSHAIWAPTQDGDEVLGGDSWRCPLALEMPKPCSTSSTPCRTSQGGQTSQLVGEQQFGDRLPSSCPFPSAWLCSWRSRCCAWWT